jgi:hypothetical protein
MRTHIQKPSKAQTCRADPGKKESGLPGVLSQQFLQTVLPFPATLCDDSLGMEFFWGVIERSMERLTSAFRSPQVKLTLMAKAPSINHTIGIKYVACPTSQVDQDP